MVCLNNKLRVDPNSFLLKSSIATRQKLNLIQKKLNGTKIFTMRICGRKGSVINSKWII